MATKECGHGEDNYQIRRVRLDRPNHQGVGWLLFCYWTLLPKTDNRDMLKSMKKRAVLIDVAIDQGGCFETSRPYRSVDLVL